MASTWSLWKLEVSILSPCNHMSSKQVPVTVQLLKTGSFHFPMQPTWGMSKTPRPFMRVYWVCFSPVWLLATQWTVAHQAPLSVGFSRQEYWSGLPCPSPGNLPNPGIKSASLMSCALASRFFNTSATWQAQTHPLHPLSLQGTSASFNILIEVCWFISVHTQLSGAHTTQWLAYTTMYRYKSMSCTYNTYVYVPIHIIYTYLKVNLYI